MGIAQLAHAVGESVFCHEGWRCDCSHMTLGRTSVVAHIFSNTGSNMDLAKKFTVLVKYAANGAHYMQKLRLLHIVCTICCIL